MVVDYGIMEYRFKDLVESIQINFNKGIMMYSGMGLNSR